MDQDEVSSQLEPLAWQQVLTFDTRSFSFIGQKWPLSNYLFGFPIPIPMQLHPMYFDQILLQFGDSKWLRPIYNNRPNFSEIVTASNWIVQTLWINFSYTYWDEIMTGRSTRFIWWTGFFGVSVYLNVTLMQFLIIPSRKISDLMKTNGS